MIFTPYAIVVHRDTNDSIFIGDQLPTGSLRCRERQLCGLWNDPRHRQPPLTQSQMLKELTDTVPSKLTG